MIKSIIPFGPDVEQQCRQLVANSVHLPDQTKTRPALRDRVVQAALKTVLEPIFEADFKPCSYGFRPGRRAHDAIAEIHMLATNSYEWVLEADITACLEPSSHCLSAVEGGVEQGAFGLWGQYSQAFAASVADVEGL